MHQHLKIRPLLRLISLAVVLAITLYAVPALAEEGVQIVDPDGIQRLQEEHAGQVQIHIDRATGVASFVRMPRAEDGNGGANGASVSRNPQEIATEFLRAHGSIFGIQDADRELSLVASESDALGSTHLSYQQLYQGIEVFGALLRVHVDRQGNVSVANGTFVPQIKISAVASIDAESAAQIAVRRVLAKHGQRNVSTGIAAIAHKQYIFRTGLAQNIVGRNHLVYEVEVANPRLTVHEFVYVDAQSGAIVDQITGIFEIERKISEETLDNVVWDEGNGDPDPIPGDWMGASSQLIQDWQNEIDGAKEAYNFFASLTGGAYLSYDGADATMRTVNNDPTISCPNANWNGISTNYCTDVTGDDTVAHEWGHAYTQFTHDLIYQWQPGAMNEAYSDIWGEAVDLINGRGIDTPDLVRTPDFCSSDVAGANFPGAPTEDSVRWLSGEDDSAFFDVPTGSGNAIRDMWNPTCFGDAGKVSDVEYFCSTADSGGVHSNSGIPNHAFALLVDGGTYNDVTVDAIGLTKAAHIYWRAATVYQTPISKFPDHADALEASCADLTGVQLFEVTTSDVGIGNFSNELITAADCSAVAAAMEAVEMRLEPTQCAFEPAFDEAPPLCQDVGEVETILFEDWESGSLPAGWSVGTRDLVKPETASNPDWSVVDNLPNDRGGFAMFVPDTVNLGDCQNDIEAGVYFLESPVITLPVDAEVPHIAIDHLFGIELGWDGGNFKISVNGGPYQLIPAVNFEVNAYNTDINPNPPNDNPLGGEPGFTGGDGGEVITAWGQSQISLSGLAGPGDTIQIRADFGVDGCNGVVGWYLDDLQVYSCSDELPGQFCGNGVINAAETCDDGNTTNGDGCSDLCLVEDNYTCTLPTGPGDGTNVVQDGSFEEGTPNPVWSEFSTNAGSPLCDASCGGPGGTDGDWYVWFGGFDSFEEGSVEQGVFIPDTATSIDFDFLVGVCDESSSEDRMRLLIDGVEIFTTDPCTAGTGYERQSIEIGEYADGEMHMVRFEALSAAPTGEAWSNFFVDNVVISDNIPTEGTASICTPIPHIEVSPGALSVSLESGDSQDETLMITNVGAGDLQWTITEDPGSGAALPLYASTVVASGRAGEGTHTLTRNAPAVDPTLIGNSSKEAAPSPTAGVATITHSLSQTIADGNSIACPAGDNSHIRVFDLAAFGIGSTFDVTDVEFGVQVAVAEAGSQEIVVNLYTLDGDLLFANMTQIGSATMQLADTGLTLISMPVSGSVPPGGILVVEVLSPDDGEDGFRIGSNAEGQTAPSYLAAAACGAVEPTDIAALGFPDMHIVMNVTGNVGDDLLPCFIPGEIPWLSASPESGTTADSPSDVTVTFDADGLSGGTYEGRLCINSDDPDMPLVQVPVSLQVEGGDLLYLSSRTSGRLGDLRVRDEDIFAYNLDSGDWLMIFDGSDVGLGRNDVDAFALMSDGSLLISLISNQSVAGVGNVRDSDVLRFVPTSLGAETAGSFELYLDGSDVGLSRRGEDIDATALTAEGLVVSTNGNFNVPGIGGRDEDLILFNATSTGADSAGDWQRYFDGSDVGLRSGSEDLSSAWVDGATGDIYLTTKGNFRVRSSDGTVVRGGKNDILVCTPESLGEETVCAFSLFWHGEDAGYRPWMGIDSMAVGGAVEISEPTEAASVTSVPDDATIIDDLDDEQEVDDENDTDADHEVDDQSDGNVPIYLPIIVQ